jgi:hypothetical protein
MMKSRLAAEAWDAKGLACPTRDYEDAAVRLKNGSCEDDEPSQFARSALPRARAIVRQGREAALSEA